MQGTNTIVSEVSPYGWISEVLFVGNPLYGRLVDPLYGRLVDPLYGRLVDPLYGRLVDPLYGRLVDSKLSNLDKTFFYCLNPPKH